jgi:hypothetical protein
MSRAVNAVSTITSAVFTVEVALKIVIEGFEPMNFFRDKENGSFNTFDFVIVLCGCTCASFDHFYAILTPIPQLLLQTCSLVSKEVQQLAPCGCFGWFDYSRSSKEYPNSEPSWRAS